jgi:tetratricopeptide (TPR) repeat protein
MPSLRPNTFVILGALLGAMLVPKAAVAADLPAPRQLLARYVTELQKSPENQPLRERIIKLERTLSPSEAVPEAALRSLEKAAMFQKEAIDIRNDDALAMTAHAFAISAYKDALLIAPWWAKAYAGLSASLEASGRFDDAVAALDLFIIAAPDAASAGAAEARLCAMLGRPRP